MQLLPPLQKSCYGQQNTGKQEREEDSVHLQIRNNDQLLLAIPSNQHLCRLQTYFCLLLKICLHNSKHVFFFFSLFFYRGQVRFSYCNLTIIRYLVYNIRSAKVCNQISYATAQLSSLQTLRSIGPQQLSSISSDLLPIFICCLIFWTNSTASSSSLLLSICRLPVYLSYLRSSQEATSST